MSKKRAQEGFSLQQLIGTIIVVVLLLITLYVFGKWGSVFFSSAKTQGTLKNFRGVADIINKRLTQDANIFSADENYPFYISDDYILVGFSTDEVTTQLDMVVECGDSERILKPPQCEKLACLCLWEDSWGDDFEDDGGDGFQNIEDCIILPNVDYVFTYYYENYANFMDDDVKKGIITHNMIGEKYNYAKFNYYKGWTESYAPLVIYGECDNHWSDEITKPQRLYMEKFEDPVTKKTSIFITIRSDHTIKRYTELRSKYVPRSMDEYIIEFKQFQDNYQNLFHLYKFYVKDKGSTLINDAKTNDILFNLFANVTDPKLNLPAEAKEYALKFFELMDSNNYWFTDWDDSKKVRAQYMIALLTTDNNEKQQIIEDLEFYNWDILNELTDHEGITLIQRVEDMKSGLNENE